MTKEEIKPFASQITRHPQATVVTFKDNSQLVGFFDIDKKNIADEEKNFWSFMKFNDSQNSVFTHFNGDDVISIEIKNKG